MKRGFREVDFHLDIKLHEIIKGITYSFSPPKTQGEVINDLLAMALDGLAKQQKIREDIKNMNNVHEDVKWILSTCNDLRDQIEVLKEFSQDVIKEASSLTFPGVDEGEIRANFKLAYRHLEDARMRLGKVMQAAQGGTSIFDREDAPQPEKLPGVVPANRPEQAHGIPVDEPAELPPGKFEEVSEPSEPLPEQAQPVEEPVTASETAEIPEEGIDTSLSDTLKEEEVIVDPVEETASGTPVGETPCGIPEETEQSKAPEPFDAEYTDPQEDSCEDSACGCPVPTTDSPLQEEKGGDDLGPETSEEHY